MCALGLPILPKNKGGRPRTPLERDIRRAQRWAQAINAKVEATALEALGVVQERKARQARKIRKLLANGAPPHLVAAARAELDKMGRFSSAPIKPPSAGLKAQVDREIAKEEGISARQVRRIRSDVLLKPFCAHP